MLRIDWSGPLTTGRQVYARFNMGSVLHMVNYQGGWLVGWDRWSDGRILLDPMIGLGSDGA